MSEQCPARAVEPILTFDDEEIIPESRLPEACLACVHRAQEDPASKVETVDTYDRALARAREHVDGPDLPADRFDSWNATDLHRPANGPARRVLIQSGFDLGLNYGLSYEPGSESYTEDIEFDCYVEKSGQASQQ